LTIEALPAVAKGSSRLVEGDHGGSRLLGSRHGKVYEHLHTGVGRIDI
jgi:hypothetical protein